MFKRPAVGMGPPKKRKQKKCVARVICLWGKRKSDLIGDYQRLNLLDTPMFV